MSVSIRDASLSLLAKMGVEVGIKISTARAQTRLLRLLQRKGIPVDLTLEERDVVVGLGLDLPPLEQQEPEPATVPETEPSPTEAKRISGAASFKRAFEVQNSYPRQELIALVKEESGIVEVANYIALAKKTDLFGFRLVQEGKNLIRREIE